MKIPASITLPLLLLLASCMKNNDLPRTETITSGNKWGIQTGSSYTDVYQILRTLGPEKGFDAIALEGQQPLTNLQELAARIPYYNAVTIQSNNGVIDRVMITINDGKVSSLDAGGGMLSTTSAWPQGVPEDMMIRQGDTTTILLEKLSTILTLPGYTSYQAILPDKPLQKPFDPAMENHNEWAFSFVEKINPSRDASYAVRLLFKNGRLDKITYTYNETDVIN